MQFKLWQQIFPYAFNYEAEWMLRLGPGLFKIFVVFPLESACSYYNSDFTTYSQEYKDFLKKYFLAQIDGFEYGKNGAGWYVYLEQMCINVTRFSSVLC